MRSTRVVALILLFPLLAACGRPSPSAIRWINNAAPAVVPVDALPAVTTTTSAPVVAHPSRVPPRASRDVSRAAPAYSGDIYDALAMCESHMNPQANTGNGFHGAFQWMLSTWHALGQPGVPEDFDYAYQKAVVMRSMPVSSWHSQFPVCSRRIGV